jgi:YrbI family 3-deoxy-D-manno-octulosonate 8-phosphate phosphatase
MAERQGGAKVPPLGAGSLDAILLDFDGVLTDNKVYVSQDGTEAVACSRSDGLAMEALRSQGMSVCIVSREKNPVVKARGDKLGIRVVQAVGDKRTACAELARQEGWSLERLLFVGNDLNDHAVMAACGYSACPSDSHAKILALARYPLKTRGGEGVLLEIADEVLGVDVLAYLQGTGTQLG